MPCTASASSPCGVCIQACMVAAAVLLHVEQLDVEDQVGIRRDRAAAFRAIAQRGGNDERALAAHLHAGDALIPAGDDHAAAELERERLAADGTVELFAVVLRRVRQ